MPGLTSILSTGWRVAATLASPLLRLHLRRRARRGREVCGRLGERLGIDPTLRPDGILIWLHAASVGETVSIFPLLPFLTNHAHVLLTTGTVTSQTLLAARAVELAPAGRLYCRFAPLDVPAWIDRFLEHWRPNAAVFVESELWPNQLAACRARNIPAILINARMSERSFRSWSRVPGFARHLLSTFRRIDARSDSDADRFRALGAEAVNSPGDLKFAAPALPADEQELARLQALIGQRPVWVAASTHPGEESSVVEAHRRLVSSYPDLLTIIVPRHPERGVELAASLKAPRRAGDAVPRAGGIWIADTLGELGLWYRLAPIAFVGRSLIPPGGGQNPLEPARLGCAVVVGPFTGNFLSAVALLREAGGLKEVSNADDLAAFVGAMLADPAALRQMRQRAASVASRYQDLPEKAANALLSLVS